MATKSSDSKNYKIEDYSIQKEPFYIPVSDEVQVFESAYNQKVPILLKGPTGTGKTRFVEYMSWYISNNVKKSVPLITVACHEDLTASDLVGRYLIDSAGTKWIDGPLTRAVKSGGICYLDEIVEARKDTTVIVHPLTDHRRILTIDKLGEVVEAADGFLMVVSYNPGYQNALKDLKQSTRQRFVAIEFDFPTPELEAKVLKEEAGIDDSIAESLASLGEKIRNLTDHGLSEAASTRVLIYAGKLIKDGIDPRRACQVAVTWGITDDKKLYRSIEEVISAIFP
ncbi:MAG: AAA family ATPase [Dehalococcoidia bacterium]|nr:AAA family ATPase [Dehalococcoidia bacterium]MEC7920625.1 CbbQ/NirQ/NorQ/GpvN family protein [Chloroflexota bacterium]MEC9450827.1 CbbQ/NirQ/NorQ/GpvN family protein [Chloroflexota bacterium]MQG04837.1 CbbQ/NirQ/NorQ/GpvN family protein [SAR202 cluster bacterium]|tara:strand:+ start:13194 stop:14042 length:849 start_codon:yes stop_codon:yes gene_type:complete